MLQLQKMTLLTWTIPSEQNRESRLFRVFPAILLLFLTVFPFRLGWAIELENPLAQAHFTAAGWQSTVMRVEGSYTNRAWKELHLAQLRVKQQVVILFQDIQPTTLTLLHSGTSHQGQSQTRINITVNGHLIDSNYHVPCHREPGTAPAASAMPPLRSWSIGKWVHPGENTITITLHPDTETVYWLKDIWLSRSENVVKGLKVKPRTDKARRFMQGYQSSHALLIGVSDYSAGWPDLLSVPSEMETLARTLRKSGFEAQIILDPTSDDLRKVFSDFIGRYGYTENNRLLFFYSGHGYSRKHGTKGYLVPTDAPDPRVDESGFLRKALSMAQVLTWAREIEAKHAIFVFDSCFSGTVFKSKALPQVPLHISAITARPVRQFITAGGAGEEVPAKSVFLPSFVRALQGEADVTDDGYVTGTELGMYLHDKVISYRTGQTPQYGKIRDPDLDEGDFVFAVGETDHSRELGQADEGRLISIQSFNLPGHFIRHWHWQGMMTKIKTNLDKKDAGFKLVQGLADKKYTSFESVNYPQHYLRHYNYGIKLDRLNDDPLFKQDATFKVVKGLADKAWISLESFNYPRYYIRHKKSQLYLEQGSGLPFKQDATFNFVEALSN